MVKCFLGGSGAEDESERRLTFVSVIRHHLLLSSGLRSETENLEPERKAIE